MTAILERKQRINNLIVISDLHTNCRLGLFPKGYKMRLDDGGHYIGSDLQTVVWGWWLDFWNNWVPEVTRGEPFMLAVNGDTIDGGAHHGNTTHISANKTDQGRLAVHILKPVVRRAKRLYVVRGTEVHVGASGCDEEAIAEELGAVPNKVGQYSRWRLRLRVGNALVDLAHHIGTTGSMAYESSAILKELEQIYVDSARWSEEPPDVVVRSHRHTNAEVRIQRRKEGAPRGSFATSCTTPGWQLKTPFAQRVPGARRTRPQFGGTLVRFGDEDIYTRHYVQSIQETEIEEG